MRQRPPAGRHPPRLALLLAAAAALLSPRAASAAPLTPPARGLDGRWLRWAAGRSCPFAHSPYAAVRDALRGAIVGQDGAVASLLGAVRAWQDDGAGEPAGGGGAARPLVLALVGPTGVGKTAAAQAIARALLPATHGGLPDGLVLLHGSQFTSDAAAGGDVGRHLQGIVAQAMYECHGTVVVVFDEAQQAQRRALAALKPLMQASPTLHVAGGGGAGGGGDGGDGGNVRLVGRRVVIIVISDVGQPRIEQQLLIASASARRARPAASAAGDAITAAAAATAALEEQRLAAQHLTNLLRMELTSEWLPSGVDLGAIAHAVAVFHPVDQAAGEALAAHAVRGMGHPDALLGGVGRLVAQLAPTAAALMDPRGLVGFSPISGGDAPPAAAAAAAIAADGAASVQPPHVARGLLALCLPPEVARAQGRHSDCRCALPPHVISSSGARGVLHHEGSAPLSRLRARVLAAVEAWEARGPWGAVEPHPTVRVLPGGALETEYRRAAGEEAVEPRGGGGGEGAHDRGGGAPVAPRGYLFAASRRAAAAGLAQRAEAAAGAVLAAVSALGGAPPPPPLADSELVLRVETACPPGGGAPATLTLRVCNVTDLDPPAADQGPGAWVRALGGLGGAPAPPPPTPSGAGMVRETCWAMYVGSLL